MHGWMFELWFFACIPNCGLSVQDAFGNTERWHQCSVESFSTIPRLTKGGIWLRSAKWNQDGYDAIYINKKDKLV